MMSVMLLTLARSMMDFNASESLASSSLTSASSVKYARPSAAHFLRSTSLAGLHRNLAHQQKHSVPVLVNIHNACSALWWWVSVKATVSMVVRIAVILHKYCIHLPQFLMTQCLTMSYLPTGIYY